MYRKLILAGISLVPAAIVLTALLNTESKQVFKRGTIINQTDVSGRTVEEANTLLAAKTSDVFLVENNEEYILCQADEIGTVSYMDSLLNDMVNQTSSDDIIPVIQIDQDALRERISAFAEEYNTGKRMPEDAYIRWDGIFTVIPETEGETIQEKLLYAAVKDSLEKGRLSVDISDTHTHASITQEDIELTARMESLNAMEDYKVNVGGGKDLIIPKEKWQPAVQYENGIISVNEDLITEAADYIEEHYNTFGKARSFITHSGQEIQIGGSHKDTFGYKLNKEKTVEAVREGLLNGTSAEAVWDMTGGPRNGKNDIGDTYAEVSIQEQHMWLYKDDEIILDTDVVTGKMDNGGTTPGVFQVLYKESPAVLKGRDYTTHVSYWMPFTWTGTGFHDAPWRGAFGGQIYIHGGSHGCVNMPSAKAKELFSLIDAGLPVVVY